MDFDSGGTGVRFEAHTGVATSRVVASLPGAKAPVWLSGSTLKDAGELDTLTASRR